MSDTQNKNVILVMGRPNSGKSSSLMNLANPEKWVYLNCDLKALPFRNKFAASIEVTDPKDILDYIDEIESNEDVSGAIIDTVTFLMQTYERLHVTTAVNTQAAWGAYGNFYRDLIHRIKSGTKHYIILAHEESTLNETTGLWEVKVPVKGSVGKVGVEGDFTVIVSAKNLPISKLDKFKNDLLNITEDDIEDGIKRVFVTRTTKETVGEKMRAPLGMWQRSELYIDNDLNQVIQRINDYYA